MSDKSVNSIGEMVLLPKETFLKMDQKLEMLSESNASVNSSSAHPPPGLTPGH